MTPVSLLLGDVGLDEIRVVHSNAEVRGRANTRGNDCGMSYRYLAQILRAPRVGGDLM